MSMFKVEVVKVKIEPHPNADRLDLAVVGGYRSVVAKGQFKTGDLAAYIPEGSVLPDCLLEEMGLTGKLAGSQKNRVTAVKLRGVLSQGLCYPARDGWEEGDSVAGLLNITKYEPPIPTCLAGEAVYVGTERAIPYDIENVKRWPDVILEGDEVIFTEKIHGTFFMLGVMPEHMEHEEEGAFIVSSKGLAAKKLALKKSNENNLYIRAFHTLQCLDGLRAEANIFGRPIFILGEIFGKGCQDLGYGYDTTAGDIGLRIFDVYMGMYANGYFLNHRQLDYFCDHHGLNRVPVLYKGPFKKSLMLEYTDGKETVSGNELHLREGIVIRPVEEWEHVRLGRVQLKSVSADYLTRKGGTEFN